MGERYALGDKVWVKMGDLDVPCTIVQRRPGHYEGGSEYDLRSRVTGFLFSGIVPRRLRHFSAIDLLADLVTDEA